MAILGRSGKGEDVTHRTQAHSILGASEAIESAISLAVSRVNRAIEEHGPVWVSAGLSGGHDSIAATYIASRASKFNSAFHIDTGVGLKATEDFVESLCEKAGWPLEVFRALENHRHDGTPDPQDYFALIEARGFPGPAMHWKMYQRLKQRQIERWARAHKKFRSREVLMIVSGRRQQESARRKRTVLGEVECEGRVIWSNPLWDFSKLDCLRIISYAGLPRSPVVDLIHKSGECLCGAFGSQAELNETALWFPDDPTIRRLLECQPRLRCKFGWGWGEKPPGGKKDKPAGPMCGSCEGNRP